MEYLGRYKNNMDIKKNHLTIYCILELLIISSSSFNNIFSLFNNYYKYKYIFFSFN